MSKKLPEWAGSGVRARFFAANALGHYAVQTEGVEFNWREPRESVGRTGWSALDYRRFCVTAWMTVAVIERLPYRSGGSTEIGGGAAHVLCREA